MRGPLRRRAPCRRIRRCCIAQGRPSKKFNRDGRQCKPWDCTFNESASRLQLCILSLRTPKGLRRRGGLGMVSTLKLKMRTRRSDSANSIAAWTAVLSRATYVRVPSTASLDMHPLHASLDIHPRHSPSASTLFIMVLVLVLYFTCTFSENTTRLRHARTHMHLSTCTLYEHLSTFTLGIHTQH